MKALLNGSYSIEAMRAGISFLSNLKSTSRNLRLWPPPRWRIVIRPNAFLPPVELLPFIRDFCGFAPERIFLYSIRLMPRVPGDVGLSCFINNLFFMFVFYLCFVQFVFCAF